MIQLNKSKILNLLKITYLVVLGALFCQNIITLFTIGNTPFNIILFLNIPIIIFELISKRKVLKNYLAKIPIYFYIFLISAIFSIISALFLPVGVGGILPLIKGFIFYSLNAIIPILIGVFLGNDRKYLFVGLLIGYFANIICSIVSYISFNFFGYPLIFNQIFINDSFFCPNYYSSIQGLFLEPSHYAGFMLISYYILYWFFKGKKVRIVLTIFTWICFLLYGRGNLPIFIISQIITLFYIYGKSILTFLRKKVFISKLKIFIFSSIILLFVCTFIGLCIGPLNSFVMDILNEANPFGPANSDRLNSIRKGLAIFARYPFGVGFNMSGPVLRYYYNDTIIAATTHSYFMKILMDQGIIGIISFLMLICSLIKATANKQKNNFFLIMGLILGIMFSFLDGPNEPYLYLFIGILSSLNFSSMNMTIGQKYNFGYSGFVQSEFRKMRI